MIVVPTRKLAIGGDDSDDEDKAKSEYIKEEILLSEKSYVDGLRVVCDVYEAPLRESGLVDEATVSAIFSNVSKLYELHKLDVIV